MFFPYFYLLMFDQCGTVFQTAVPLFLVILRLRPRLLSLCSVLASSQIYQQATKQQDNKTVLKTVPLHKRSIRVNP